MFPQRKSEVAQSCKMASEITGKPKEVHEILRAGTAQARKVAKTTLEEAKTAMKII